VSEANLVRVSEPHLVRVSLVAAAMKNKKGEKLKKGRRSSDEEEEEEEGLYLRIEGRSTSGIPIVNEV